MSQVRELDASETRRAAAALLELRPHVGSPEAMTERIDAQRAAGYRVVAAFDGDEEDAAAVAGFRIGENLAWGRFLYVDDLVTRAAARGRGHADAVMAWCDARRPSAPAAASCTWTRASGRSARTRTASTSATGCGSPRTTSRGGWRDRRRAPPARRRGEGPRPDALRRRHATSTGCCTRGRCWPPRRTRGCSRSTASDALARAGRRRGADRRRPAAGGRLGPRRGAAGARGDRVVRPAGRAGDRRDRGRRRGRRGAACWSTRSRCRRCSISRRRWPPMPTPSRVTAVAGGGDGGAGAHGAGGGRRRRRAPDSPNVAVRQRLQRGDVDAELARADAVVSARFRTNWIHQAYLEPQSTLAWVEPDGTLVVTPAPRARSWSARAWPSMLGLPLDRVRVQAAPLGGAFGGKLMISEPLAAAAALNAQAPGAARLRPQRGLRRRQPRAGPADRPRAGRHARRQADRRSAAGSSATAAGWGRWASSRSRRCSPPGRTAGPRTT